MHHEAAHQYQYVLIT